MFSFVLPSAAVRGQVTSTAGGPTATGGSGTRRSTPRPPRGKCPLCPRMSASCPSPAPTSTALPSPLQARAPCLESRVCLLPLSACLVRATPVVTSSLTSDPPTYGDSSSARPPSRRGALQLGLQRQGPARLRHHRGRCERGPEGGGAAGEGRRCRHRCQGARR